MRHTAVCETLIFSIHKEETTPTKEKRMLIEHKSNSSLDDPVWRTVRYIWLFQILAALRVSENFLMWCQKKDWLHQSTVALKTCKNPQKGSVKSQVKQVITVFLHKGSCLVARGLCITPRLCSSYPQQQRYHAVPRCPQVQRWPFPAMFPLPTEI